MSEKAGVKNVTSEDRKGGIGDDKLLVILLLGLGAVLLVALLVWRAVAKEADDELVPTEVQKHAIWFDEHGVVRKTKPTEATTTAPKRDQQAQHPVASADAEPPMVEQTPTVSTPRKPDYWIQLASFSQQENAEALRDKIAASSPSIEVTKNSYKDSYVYAVRVLVYGDRAKADKLAKSIADKHGLKPLVMTAR